MYRQAAHALNVHLARYIIVVNVYRDGMAAVHAFEGLRLGFFRFFRLNFIAHPWRYRVRPRQRRRFLLALLL